MINDAIIFAAQAHAGQVRKYTGEPYVLHTIEVMNIVRETADQWTETMLVAALLHDVLEDTPTSPEQITRAFGSWVTVMVQELTDEFIKENYPQMNRASRKAAERERLGQISAEAQTVKLADLISNTKSIAAHDPGFSKIYLREKAALLPLLSKGDPQLKLRAAFVLGEGAIRAGVDL